MVTSKVSDAANELPHYNLGCVAARDLIHHHDTDESLHDRDLRLQQNRRHTFACQARLDTHPRFPLGARQALGHGPRPLARLCR